MYIRQVGSNALLILALGLPLFSGCKKSTSETPPPVSTETPKHRNTEAPVVSDAPVIARVHWLGKKRIAAETNAAYFMSIWNMPESAKLEAQTLDKLATAPWRLMSNQSQGTNAVEPVGGSNLLRPLLNDLVAQESYLEIRRLSTNAVEAVFAIQLDEARAAFWQTNLETILKPLSREKTSDLTKGLVLGNSRGPNTITLRRNGAWIFLGLGGGDTSLLKELENRITQAGLAAVKWATNSWIEMELDLPGIANAFNIQIPTESPRIEVAMFSDGKSVRTRGKISLKKPLSVELEPWAIPTNLIQDPLIGFMAVQGIKPYLHDAKWWQSLQLGSPPNECFLWTLASTPYETYLAIPLTGSTGRVHQLTEALLSKVNPWLSANGTGSFQDAPETAGAKWIGVPYITPFIMPTGDYVFAGLFPRAPLSPPAPSELFNTIHSHTNLVFYDWEITQMRVEAFLHVSQLLRLAFNKAQLQPGSVGLSWLLAVPPKLGNCTTEIDRKSPTELDLSRQSSAGLSAAEIHLLIDWLESPSFPSGLHTMLATNILVEDKRKKNQ